MKANQIDEATLAILSRCEIDGKLIRLPQGQLERKQYLAVNEILENCGGKWSRKAKAHIFDSDPTDKLEAVLLTGEIINPQDCGCFYTPPELAQRVVALANIKPGMDVLEPSAGPGALADFVLTDCKLDCFEILPENVAILKAKGYFAEQADFLGTDTTPGYDRVVMNPPFVASSNPQTDITHVLHAWKFLKPGGRLVSIMSAGVLFRENKKTVAFRGMLNQYGHWERNPEGSFKVSGTMVRTVTIVLDKPREGIDAERKE